MSDEYIEAALGEIAAWQKETPGFLSNVGDFILKPAIKAAELLIPNGIQESIAVSVGSAVESFLVNASATATSTINLVDIVHKVAEGRNASHEEADWIRLFEGADLAAKHYWTRNLTYATVEGAATGSAGFAGLVADIPALFTIALRLIQQAWVPCSVARSKFG
jgi:hypothetical protein